MGYNENIYDIMEIFIVCQLQCIFSYISQILNFVSVVSVCGKFHCFAARLKSASEMRSEINWKHLTTAYRLYKVGLVTGFNRSKVC